MQQKDETKTIRFFSMFTGVGGFEIGLKNANDITETRRCGQEENLSESRSGSSSSQSNIGQHTFSCIGFSEIDKYASQLLANKFPTIKNYGDATKINPDELPDFDMLCGGFPCQSFSIAGKRRGFEDTRGTMFFEVARILKVKRPKIVFLENVKGLLNHNQGETFKIILQTLDELGYDVQWMVLNSKFFGVPQNRERVFIIGNLRGEPRPEILPFRESCGGNDEKNYSATITSSYKKGCNNHNQLIGEKMKIRRLTPVECERLQGFPDNYTEGFSDTQRYKMMGNAVTTKVIQAIGEKL